MKQATAIVHIAPAVGAQFVEYTAIFETGGTLGVSATPRFLYVTDGQVSVDGTILSKSGYSYQPANSQARIEAASPARAIVIEKPYEPLEGFDAPAALIGHENSIQGKPLDGDDALEVRTLLPADPSFDMAVNTMTFQPGASLRMVEIHVMEHGLVMLEGGGIYRVSDSWYPVEAGDVFWMAPYCPQWFGAIGKVPAKYLIYKDWNRHPCNSK